MSRRLSLIVAALAACHDRGELASCGDDLGGTWLAPDGMRWVVLDHGMALEGYPMAPDAPADRDVVIAPRRLDLARDEAGAISGTIRRRFMRGGDACDGHAAVHVTTCHDDTVELVTTPVVAPLRFTPCAWPAPEPARVERWRRQ